MSLDRSGLFDVLARLPFEPGRFVVAGSGPLLAMEIIESIEDVDIVADAGTWANAIRLAKRGARPGMFGDRLVTIQFDGIAVEVFDGWLGIDAESVIADAVDIDGFLFTPLERVTKSKRTLGRPKDLVHLGMIEARLDE